LPESEEVGRYFNEHAQDFDSIYEDDKGLRRGLRDRLSRGTVLRRLEYVQAYADKHEPGTALDIGCGAGRFCVPLALGGAHVTGLDFAAEMIEMAKSRAEEAGVEANTEFDVADFMDWEAPARFDLTLAVGVLDYVADPAALLRKMNKDTHGSCIVSFPKRWHYLVPLRWARLRAARCPVYFYSRRQVRRLGAQAFPRFRIKEFGRDFLMIAESD